MQIFHTISSFAAWRAQAPQPLGFVPTMGALHAGHARLIEEARAASAAAVVSIFVNPIQFNQPEDFARYPRPLEEDLSFCEQRGVDAVFAPSAEEMYPRPQSAFVDVEGVTARMEGQTRPGHFRGVTTVVMKLFQIVQPQRAWFGEKDAQQLAAIRAMVRDLNVPVAVAAVPTVREPDGLAISSRNRLLNDEERAVAPKLYQALALVSQAIASGETDPQAAKRLALALLATERRLLVEYFEIADAEMLPVAKVSGDVRALAAVWLGRTRLIDNVSCTPPAG